MNAALRELEELLAGANYFVDFQTVIVPFAFVWTPEQYITAAVGPKPPLTRVAEVGLPDVLTEVEYCLLYDRDQYSDLGRSPHKTPRFAELVAVVRAELERLTTTSTAVYRFWRDDPTEWQFSFLFVGPSSCVAFIGWGRTERYAELNHGMPSRDPFDSRANMSRRIPTAPVLMTRKTLERSRRQV